MSCVVMTARVNTLSDIQGRWLMITASSVASSSGSLVDASGYKYSEKDMKPGKIKLKKQPSGGKSAKGKKPDQSGRF